MNEKSDEKSGTYIAKRFRGFLPIVIDVETGGFNPQTDALLEIAAFAVDYSEESGWTCSELFHEHVKPFDGANMEERALAFTGIIPDHPFRFAKSEREALRLLFSDIRKKLKETGCTRAVLVGHNPMFDLSFIQAATARCQLKRSPFHPFTTFDTATLGALAVGQTVLARACKACDVAFDMGDAHSALHDTKVTAELFCAILNKWPYTL